ncbi:MAG TPA: hypothetical protein VMW63_08110 [Methanoregulaceae archaeon]|nr:hypothetical protein [Methanoregulaceae archaeon]
MRLVQITAIIDIPALISLIPIIILGAVTQWILPTGGEGFRGGTGVLTETLFI